MTIIQFDRRSIKVTESIETIKELIDEGNNFIELTRIMDTENFKGECKTIEEPIIVCVYHIESIS